MFQDLVHRPVSQKGNCGSVTLQKTDPVKILTEK